MHYLIFLKLVCYCWWSDVYISVCVCVCVCVTWQFKHKTVNECAFTCLLWSYLTETLLQPRNVFGFIHIIDKHTRRTRTERTQISSCQQPRKVQHDQRVDRVGSAGLVNMIRDKLKVNVSHILTVVWIIRINFISELSVSGQFSIWSIHHFFWCFIFCLYRMSLEPFIHCVIVYI